MRRYPRTAQGRIPINLTTTPEGSDNWGKKATRSVVWDQRPTSDGYALHAVKCNDPPRRNCVDTRNPACRS